MNTELLAKRAKELVANNKGILAADESTATIGKRFAENQIEDTEENRRTYRQLLFTAPGMEKYISGVIMFDETIRQAEDNGLAFPELLNKLGVAPGIKVDHGTVPLSDGSTEKLTTGLDGLAERLAEYKKLGAQFAKWRAVIIIDESQNFPTDNCLEANAKALAEYAYQCQLSDIVPIVEPEVLMDGKHDWQKCFEVANKLLSIVFKHLRERGVELSGILLKPNMILSGSEFGQKCSPAEVAENTLRCLKEQVPAEVPGIVFLSGGQREEEATENLQTINLIAQNMPWELSFSYGRALQNSALRIWSGKAENVIVAQQAFLKRAELNWRANGGE
jgi:fructose-bisphosphate aldolase class I